MSKKAVALISNDQHIKDDNVEEKKGLFKQQCELAIKLKINTLILLGDLFDSRKSQTLNVLNCVSEIFETISNYGLSCHVIPGNHCKTSYSSNSSFLDQFKHHPNIYIWDIVRTVNINGLEVVFVPFWEDSILVDKLSTVKKDSIVLSHFGTNGSINNDGSLHKSNITVESLKRFKKVLLGHFHNSIKISSNIFHLPSIQQNNFGEDEDKGFTVLYEDGSHELVKSKFKSYKKVKIDVDKLSKSELNEVIKEYTKEAQTSYVRFILEGREENLKSIDKDKFFQVGIDVKTKSNEIGIIEDFDTVEISQYTDDNIVEQFEQFCEEKGLDFKQGIKYLK